MGRLRTSTPSLGRPRSASATRVSSRRPPTRSSSAWPWVFRILTTPVPTVPSPRSPSPISLMAPVWGEGPGWPGRVLSRAKAPQTAESLARPLLILYEGEPHVAFAEVAEADPGRHRHLAFLDEQLDELERAQGAEGVGNRGPHEHSSAGS